MRPDPEARAAARRLADAIAQVDMLSARGEPWVVVEDLGVPGGHPGRYWSCRLRTWPAYEGGGAGRVAYMPLACRPGPEEDAT